MKTEDEKEIEKIIDEEISKCSERVYPNICQIKDSKQGREKIFELCMNIIYESGMSVKSALAQVESSL